MSKDLPWVLEWKVQDKLELLQLLMQMTTATKWNYKLHRLVCEELKVLGLEVQQLGIHMLAGGAVANP